MPHPGAAGWRAARSQAAPAGVPAVGSGQVGLPACRHWASRPGGACVPGHVPTPHWFRVVGGWRCALRHHPRSRRFAAAPPNRAASASKRARSRVPGKSAPRVTAAAKAKPPRQRVPAALGPWRVAGAEVAAAVCARRPAAARRWVPALVWPWRRLSESHQAPRRGAANKAPIRGGVALPKRQGLRRFPAPPGPSRSG